MMPLKLQRCHDRYHNDAIITPSARETIGRNLGILCGDLNLMALMSALFGVMNTLVFSIIRYIFPSGNFSVDYCDFFSLLFPIANRTGNYFFLEFCDEIFVSNNPGKIHDIADFVVPLRSGT
jgi:hypothetical protein